MRHPKTETRPASDGAARRRIAEDLSTTILVEAAAGTGKTHCLVERMVALITTGYTTIERLSAVTFTVKGAGQLRRRFQEGMECALETASDESARARLREALAHLDSCFLGTIHAFCARLLRERPVEAGVDPGFEEMDEPQDGAARDAAWERFASALFVAGDRRLARLMELGVPLQDLRETYQTVCENSDVAVSIGQQTPEPDFARERAEIARFLEKAAAAVPDEVPTGGWTGFQEAIRSARRLWELLDVSRGRDFIRILRVLERGSAASKAGPFKTALENLQERVVCPALARWAEHGYPVVMDLLVEARDAYRDWRRREGRLNFQDLLLAARDLLRDHPHVRRSLADRFTPILVDEFQDTDPIQAEILFFLTGEDLDETDWLRLAPRPGSLFVVGDPKQSIYRFRRADIETYGLVRERIARCGRILELSTNYRSTLPVCDWINAAFAARFPARPTPEQPAYVALEPADGAGSAGPSAFCLTTQGRTNADVVRMDAAAIADAIASAVSAGQRSPGDFLILLRRRYTMPDYARALEERGIRYEMAGGGAFKGSGELKTLLAILETLADPDNPVPLVAALRGPIFGIHDDALYRFRRAGGRFHFRRELPSEADPRIAEAYQLFRESAELAEALAPGAAIAKISEKVGWTALSAALPLGDSRAGNLMKAFAAARTLSGEGRDFFSVVESIRGLQEQELIEQMGLEPGRPDAVRILTLHAAKGLEAPVVFLADPTGEREHRPKLRIERRDGEAEGFFRVSARRGDHGEEDLALPEGWGALCETELSFDRAERVRLLYVASTRAREKLIVGIRTNAKGVPSGPWAALAAHLPQEFPRPAISAPAPPQAPPQEETAVRLDDSRRLRAERLGRCLASSYLPVSVTALTHAGSDRPAWESAGHGMEWGRILHRLLEAVMRDAALDVESYARNLFTEEERGPEDLDEVVGLVERVRASPLWRRALAARRRLVEVPFALRGPGEQGGRVSGAETLLQGAIDLVFEEEEGWVVVDYKSDIVSENRQSLIDFYRPQVELYRKYWEKLTGQKTTAGLYFIQTGEEVWL